MLDDVRILPVQNPLFQFGNTPNSSIGYVPDLFGRVPSPSQRFQPVTQRSFSKGNNQVNGFLFLVITAGAAKRFFLNYQLNCFQSNATLFIRSVADAKQGVTILFGQELGPSLSRLEMGM